MKTLIVNTKEYSDSPTFVQMHADRLPGQVTFVGGLPPAAGGKTIVSPTVAQSVNARLLRTMGFGHAARIRIARALYGQIIRKVNPSVVLCEFGKTGPWVSTACGELGIPFVVHFHGGDASRARVLRDYHQDYAAMFRQAHAVIGVSRPMCAKLESLGAPASIIRYNPYGVDSVTGEDDSSISSEKILLSVGRFVEKKSPALTIRAFHSVKSRFPGSRLRMIGDGPLRRACQALVSELGIEASVDFLGRLNPAAVRREMRSATAFVQHSRVARDGDTEGTPVAILEAGAMGLPVVSTIHAGIPEAVVQGKTGLLVEEGDVEGMAKCMVRLIQDRKMAEEMGRAAKQHVTSNYSCQKSISNLFQILCEATGAQRERS